MQLVRAPAVAGAFYPASEQALGGLVDRLLAEASAAADPPCSSARPHEGPRSPKAIIVPHAGYVYSGSVAARAFARIAPFGDRIRRVVLVGPAHREHVEGLVAPGVSALRTPLGDVCVDAAALDALGAPASPVAHAREHSLEVELPFLQRVAPKAKVVPLAVGRASPAEVARVLTALWGGPETVIVISSDLSHFLPYDLAREADQRTAARIVGLEGPLSGQEACGAAGINGLLRVAKAKGLRVEVVDLRSSGDTAGGRDEVVGYGAFAFYEVGGAVPVATADVGRKLVRYARAKLREELGGPIAEVPEGCDAPGATFVTLRWRDGRLQGCIGSLEPKRSLASDVAHNAVAAAVLDPRAEPIGLRDVDDLDVELSVLSPLEPVPFTDEASARAGLVPGKHGIVLAWRGRRATFLPAVWDQFHSAEELMAALKQKAGLPSDFWRNDMNVWRYTVDKHVDPAPARHAA